MTTHTVADHIRKTEHARLSALVQGNIEAASALHAPDFQLITPIGDTLSKAQYLGAIAAGQIKYLNWEPDSIDVRVAGTAAIIRYRSNLSVVFGGYKVPPAQYWHTDFYELRDHIWQVVWSQATEIRPVSSRGEVLTA
ncbi:nuclear transport factor 2 family protein [Iodobacter sp. HSC-16F04]|uniref:Nuclear transport factor 2 family protein n=1 Tax=Iodobacter violaceini TaxID=3044271 RepID=A0ABX0KZ24_9NEIS|nr:nuclear transport factor 2 family protein [Iodobacter violacea]NHQ87492.1 nuclear transport factor 2 family protein [Iodobacter violacea]